MIENRKTIVDIVTKFQITNYYHVKLGLKPLTNKDLDKRLTIAGYTMKSEEIKDLIGGKEWNLY